MEKRIEKENQKKLKPDGETDRKGESEQTTNIHQPKEPSFVPDFRGFLALQNLLCGSTSDAQLRRHTAVRLQLASELRRAVGPAEAQRRVSLASVFFREAA